MEICKLLLLNLLQLYLFDTVQFFSPNVFFDRPTVCVKRESSHMRMIQQEIINFFLFNQDNSYSAPYFYAI